MVFNFWVMKKKSESKEDIIELRRNPIRVFTCGHKDCEKIDSMTFDKFKEHLTSVHGLTADQMKGKKQMVAHIDADEWFSSTYQWTLESGLTFIQYSKLARDGKFYH